MIFIAVFLFTGCSFKSDSAQRTLDYEGVYVGTLPCADCEGIRTLIKLFAQNVYEKEVVYLGEKVDTYFSRGTYSWDSSGNIIHLDDATAYFVKKDKLYVLDKNGKIIQGQLQHRYILSKFGVQYAIDKPSKEDN